MAELEYVHICDYAFTGEGNKACIIGLFDAINAPVFPYTHPIMYVTSKFQGAAHEVVRARVELARPNGEALAQMDPEFVMGPEGGTNVHIQLVGITFPEPGRYAVKISVGGRNLATHSLRVNRAHSHGQSLAPLRAH
jgi:hypothetical protein